MITLEELIDRLGNQYDPEQVVELLELNSREIAERFDDRVLELWDELQEEME